MAPVRVTSRFMDGGVQTPQVMVFDTVLNEDSRMLNKPVFGYLTDDNDDDTKYPFIITFSHNIGDFDWGGYAEDGLVTSTNILQHVIQVGEFFTRFEIDNGETYEYTYCITEINALCNH